MTPRDYLRFWLIILGTFYAVFSTVAVIVVYQLGRIITLLEGLQK